MDCVKERTVSPMLPTQYGCSPLMLNVKHLSLFHFKPMSLSVYIMTSLFVLLSLLLYTVVLQYCPDANLIMFSSAFTFIIN